MGYPSLLLACRRIHSEAAAIFYGANPFRFIANWGRERVFNLWLKSIGSRNRALLKRVEIKDAVLVSRRDFHRAMQFWYTGFEKHGAALPVGSLQMLVSCVEDDRGKGNHNIINRTYKIPRAQWIYDESQLAVWDDGEELDDDD